MLIAALLAVGLSSAALDAPAQPQREFRAAWIATVDNIDWPSKKGLPTSQAKEELRNMIARCHETGLNALIFQVRPMADALYKSPIEPWSEFLTGQQGKPPDQDWDPLQFAIEECHKRGMELHAWFNPYRVWHVAAKGPASGKHISRAHPELVRKYGKQKWMDPGEPRVQDYSLRVIMDVVKRYDLDGVHIDDYFYPYPVANTPFPDAATHKKYGKGQSRDAWRRQNVDRFVKRLHDSIKAEKKWVKFGISPFGIYRPNFPTGVQAGLDQYAQLYADARKWLNQGWCDYFTPQLYWSLDSTGQPYERLLNWWIGENKHGRHIWPGLAAYKINEGPKWDPMEMANQIEASRRSGEATGHVFFSAKYIVNNTKGLADVLRGTYMPERRYENALAPSSPWIDTSAPAAPKVTVEKGSDRKDWTWSARFGSGSDRDVRFMCVWLRNGMGWGGASLVGPGQRMLFGGEKFHQAADPLEVAVAAVSKTGVVGAVTRVMRPKLD